MSRDYSQIVADDQLIAHRLTPKSTFLLTRYMSARYNVGIAKTDESALDDEEVPHSNPRLPNECGGLATPRLRLGANGLHRRHRSRL